MRLNTFSIVASGQRSEHGRHYAVLLFPQYFVAIPLPFNNDKAGAAAAVVVGAGGCLLLLGLQYDFTLINIAEITLLAVVSSISALMYL